MNIYDAIKQRRTIRKFTQQPVDTQLLMKFVDAARVCPSAANIQPLRYKIVNDPITCDSIFPCLRWAGYLPNGTPEKNERPTAYIVVTQDMSVKPTESSYDAGAAMMAMTLCAQEEGIGHCWIGSIDRKQLASVLDLPENLQIILVLALGYGAQESVEDTVNNGNIRYRLDSDNILHVPKLSLEDILL